MKIMDSELDIDKMDYLLRDSLYCDVTYGKYDLERLVTSLTIFQPNSPRLAIKKGGMHAVEAFILVRYFMFMQVYFHKLRRLYDLMLSKFIREVMPDGKYPSNIHEFLSINDDMIWNLMCKEQKTANGHGELLTEN